MRRMVVLGLLVVALVPGVVLAVFPIALLPGVALVFESGAMAAAYAASAAFVGAVVFGVTFSDPQGSGQQASAPVYARLNPSAEVPVPDGWTPSSTPGGDPVPPGAEPIPGYVPPAGLKAYRCTMYKSNGVWFGTSFSGCGYDENYSDCLAWASGAGSATYITYCWVKGQSIAAHPTNWPVGVPEISGAQKKDVAPSCPPSSTMVSGECQIDPNTPFPPDGQVVINAFDGDVSVHPRDTADAGLAGLTLGADGGFSYQGRGMTGTFVPGADGSAQLRTEVVQSDGKTQVTQYDLTPNASGGYKLGGGSQSYIDGFGSGAGGTGAGSPGAGSDGSDCGGVGEPACEVDDSGFAGADAGTGLDDALSAIDARSDALGDFADSDIGVGWDWLPSLMPGAQLECTALVFEPAITHGPAAGLGGSYELDICDKLGTVREIIGWLFGLFTVFYVWRKFANSNGGMS